MTVKESGIQGRIAEAIVVRYPKAAVRIKHGTAYAVVGDPDVYGCIDGRMFVFEVKNRQGKLTRIQTFRLMEFSVAGAITGGVRSTEEALDILAYRLKSKKLSQA